MKFNPEFRIFLNSDPTGPFATMINPHTGTAVEVDDWRVVEVCGFAASPREPDECRTLLVSMGMNDEGEASRAMRDLVNMGVLVPDDAVMMSIWDEYNWREAAYFHFLTRNQQFVEDGAVDSSELERRAVVEGYLRESEAPAFYADVRGARHPLVAPLPLLQMDPLSLLRARKTTRSFHGNVIPQAVLSSILWHGTARARALRAEAVHTYGERPEVLLDSLFCAFEVYVVVERVSEVPPGVYHYDMQNHCLVTIAEGDFEEKVVRLIWGQSMARKTAFCLFITAVFERYMWRYRYNRAYRNLLISLGEFAQILLLCAQAFGLGNCLTPGLRDSETDELLRIDPNREQALYFLGFGS